jgi:hypothetical protein
MSLIARVSQHLTARQVPHALIGAAALAIHGVARSTYDIDLLTTDVRVLDAGFWSPLQTGGARVDVRRGDADDPLAGVVRVSATALRPVDVIVGRWAWQARAVERARAQPGGVPAVEAADLVLLKLYAGGTQDLWDVQALLALPGAAELVDAVDARLAELPADMRTRWGQLRVG